MRTHGPVARRLRAVSAVLGGVLLLVPMAGFAAADPLAGAAGTDTSLPATDSQLTVNGRGPFADLHVTVNQTRDLVNQAVSVTWTGGTPTRRGPSTFAGDYLQFMQCWGDDDGSVPGNPGPPPEQCEQGASSAIYGGLGGDTFPSGSLTLERVVTRKTWANFDSTPGFLDTRTGLVWKPFRAVDGTVVDVHKDPTFNPAVVGGNFWLNPYFNIVTTNEISGGRTGANGKGAELFEVTTGLESSGLGCGQSVEPVAGGGTRIPKCWLVVVPRGTPAAENVGTPSADDADQHGVATSPLSPQAWQHRIAVPLEFNPVDTSCQLSDEQRRIVGTELVVPAVSSWQPALCGLPGLSPYAYGTVSDAGARQQLVNSTPGAPGMVVVARPLAPTAVAPANPVTYAPISVSGTVIGFNLERDPNLRADQSEQILGGVRVAEINLTPRLVAKLLTQSYSQQVEIRSVPPYDWLAKNPPHLSLDPDFLKYNPEFGLLQIRAAKNFGGLLMPARNSDAAQQVWEYVLADPEAKAWLDGAPDPWGMKVNPVYATVASANTAGNAFADPVPTSYPKSDPYCFLGPPRGPNNSIVPPPLCGIDWLPYTQSLRDAARLTRAADDGARVAEDPFAISADQVYKRDIPQVLGSRAILSITDSASAFQYGLQTARLSRAGDNGPDRKFIAADVAGLTAGVESMSSKGEPTVREPDPIAAGPSAYPLTAISYAAITPLSLNATARREYAAFIDYAAGPGQVPGLKLGQLPRGYAPMTESLEAQATAAAKTIRELEPTVGPGDHRPSEPALAPPVAAASPSIASAPRSAASSGSSPKAVASPPSAATTPPRAAPAAVPAPSTTGPPTAFTPVLALARTRFVLPGLFVVALLSALGALEITKRSDRGARGRLIPVTRAPGDNEDGRRR